MEPNLPTGETMSEGGPVPPMPGPTASSVDTVPLATLAMPDDQEQMTPPEAGDEVSYQVTGKVTAINGDQATIERTSINGQELTGAVAGPDDEAALTAEASQLDNAL